MMRLNLDMQLPDQMSEGVMLLNRQAQVLAHNAASKAWVQPCKEKSAQLEKVIDQVMQGRVKLPAKMGLFAKAEASAAPHANAWLCHDGLQNYAIFLSPIKPTKPSPEIAEKRFLSVLGDDIRQHMSALRALLQDRADDPARFQEAVVEHTTQLEVLLTEISALPMLMQNDQLLDDARLEMDELITQLLPTLKSAHNKPYIFTPGSSRWGVLFGNVAWLSYALVLPRTPQKTQQRRAGQLP